MPAFWVDPADVRGEELTLRGEEVHHLARVRRCRPGDLVEVVDGKGRWYRVRVAWLGAQEAGCRICEQQAERGESAVRLCLAVALIAGPRFDYLVEKATEVGVEEIVPLLTQRGVVRPSSARPARWQRVGLAAAKQCGRSRCPTIRPAEPVAGAVARLQAEGRAVVVARPGSRELAGLFGTEPLPTVGLLVGPEGGFTPAEEALAASAGARPFSWGERVLRVETAGVVLAALVMQEAQRARAAASGPREGT
ncbi:MAG: RsmE family RNA methyltransferase [Candidatus Latescibacterota bacterium]